MGEPDQYGGNATCNFCTLVSVMERHGAHRVEVVDGGHPGERLVRVDGKWKATFAALPATCAC